MDAARSRSIAVGAAIAIAVAVGVAVTLAVLSSGDGTEPVPTPLPTPSETASPTPAPEPIATPTTTPTPTEEPTTSPPEGGARLTPERSEPVDPEGSVAPDAEASARLEGATVTRDVDGLLATFELGAAPPERTDAQLLWTIELADAEGRLVATISVQQVGAERVAAVYDWGAGEQLPLGEGAVTFDGDVLRLRVPATSLPDLPEGTGWAASTQLDGAWETRVPGRPHDADAPYEPLAR